jgi:hypothetical protein
MRRLLPIPSIPRVARPSTKRGCRLLRPFPNAFCGWLVFPPLERGHHLYDDTTTSEEILKALAIVLANSYEVEDR